MTKKILTTLEKRDKYLKRKYGVGLDYYEAKFKEQNGACAICKKEPKKGKNLSLDHEHKSGETRGLLCFICNCRCLGRIERAYLNPRLIIEGLYNYSSKYRLKND